MTNDYYLSTSSNDLSFQKNIRSQQLDLSQNNLNNLFERFITFIDATPNTVRTYRASLRQWFLYMRQHALYRPTPEDIRQYRSDLRDAGKKPTTINNYLIAVRRFFQWTEIEGLYPNVAKYIKGAKLSRNFKKDYLSSTQAKTILNNIDRRTLKGKRDYAMLAVMLTMGLRTIEIVRANIEDIHTKGNVTVLYVQGKGHDEKDDLVRMPGHVELAIRDYLSCRKSTDPDAPLFASLSNHNNGKHMTTRSIRRIVKTSFINAGFNSPRLTAHSTRHTAATLSLLNGATLQQTQELLRHKNIQTTEIYAHNLDATKNPASSKVDDAIFDQVIQLNLTLVYAFLFIQQCLNLEKQQKLPEYRVTFAIQFSNEAHFSNLKDTSLLF